MSAAARWVAPNAETVVAGIGSLITDIGVVAALGAVAPWPYTTVTATLLAIARGATVAGIWWTRNSGTVEAVLEAGEQAADSGTKP